VLKVQNLGSTFKKREDKEKPKNETDKEGEKDQDPANRSEFQEGVDL